MIQFNMQFKNNIHFLSIQNIHSKSTASQAAYTVDIVDTVETVETVYTVDMVDMVCTIDRKTMRQKDRKTQRHKNTRFPLCISDPLIDVTLACEDAKLKTC